MNRHSARFHRAHLVHPERARVRAPCEARSRHRAHRFHQSGGIGIQSGAQTRPGRVESRRARFRSARPRSPSERMSAKGTDRVAPCPTAPAARCMAWPRTAPPTLATVAAGPQPCARAAASQRPASRVAPADRQNLPANRVCRYKIQHGAYCPSHRQAGCAAIDRPTRGQATCLPRSSVASQQTRFRVHGANRPAPHRPVAPDS